MTFFDLLIYAAAAWYIAYVLTATEGPGGVFLWIREHVWHGRHGYITHHVMWNAGEPQPPVPEPTPVKNGLLDCIICLSIWVALILVLIGMNVVTQAFAVAGIGLWLHSYSGWRYSGSSGS